MPEEVFTDAGESFATSKMVRDWLRKPFKPEQIGHLPKAGKQIDFVGHAAVTDRLNKIAPDWTYTIDNMSTIGDVVWIRLTMTIGGVSRPDFGDGKDPKEALGNALRRCAMRFGVAIDLWSREELESASPQSGADAGGRIENTSSASRDRSEGTTTAEQGHRGTAADPSGSSAGEGEASAVTAPGEGVSSSLSPSLGADHPGPPHYPLTPDECDHKSERTGHLLRPRKSPRGPVCPRCGLSYIAVTEGTTADLGAA